MIRIVSPTLGAGSTTAMSTTLTISGSFTAGFTYAYTSDSFICKDASDTLQISLVNNTAERGNWVAIRDYACSTLGALTPSTTFTPAPAPPPGTPSTSSGAPFGTNGATVVTFSMSSLPARLLVDLALFVLVVSHDGSKSQTILCDPQVGNDPD